MAGDTESSTKAKRFAEWFFECRGIKFVAENAEYIGASENGNMCWRVSGIRQPEELPVPFGSLFAAEFAGDSVREPIHDSAFVWSCNIAIEPLRVD
jgi:hypothetical protein